MENSAIYLHPDSFKDYLGKAIDYQQYKVNMINELQLLQQKPLEAARQLEYLPINLQRMRRVEKTLRLSEQLQTMLSRLDQKTNWLVLTEHWCGDAAQTLPALAAIAEASGGRIEMKILYRDQNLELMDAFLTNGARAIPRLIQFNDAYQLSGLWGPRPTDAQLLVKELKSNPATASIYGEQLHKWYAHNKQQAVQEELIALLQKALDCCPEYV